MPSASTTSPAPHSVRPPNAEELKLLWNWIKSEKYDEMYLLEEHIWYTQFYIAVFDRYVTGMPGFAGKVLYLVWDGGPEQIEVFTWDHERPIHIGKHHEECVWPTGESLGKAVED